MSASKWNTGFQEFIKTKSGPGLVLKGIGVLFILTTLLMGCQ